MNTPTNEPTKLEIELAAKVAHIDRGNAFLIFATFTGDLSRTAAALGIREIDVLRMSDEGGWMEQLKPIIELSKSSRPGDLERSINRAINLVQAHRMRMVIERVISRLTGMSPEELESWIFSEELSGSQRPVKIKRLGARALADLATAVEKAHAATYAALADTAKERQQRNEGSPETTSNEMYLKIAEAAARVTKDNSPRALLLDAQLQIVAEQKERAVKLVKQPDSKPERADSPYDQ